MKMMKALHKKRLLNVVRALRESPNPKAFTMNCYVRGDRYDATPNENWCGTPGCALGHYAARPDLQRSLFIGQDSLNTPVMRLKATRDQASYYDAVEIFGLSQDEASELFGGVGCGGATTPKQAARYIERFVARKEKEARK